MRELNKDEVSVVSGAGDLYDSPTSREGNLLVYPEDIFDRPGEPRYEIWQESIAI